MRPAGAALTEREKVALAITAGAPIQTVMNGGLMTATTTVPVRIAERGDGGYVASH